MFCLSESELWRIQVEGISWLEKIAQWIDCTILYVLNTVTTFILTLYNRNMLRQVVFQFIYIYIVWYSMKNIYSRYEIQYRSRRIVVIIHHGFTVLTNEWIIKKVIWILSIIWPYLLLFNLKNILGCLHYHGVFYHTPKS